MELDYQTAKALLDWQIELGADEAIGDVPVNWYDVATAQVAAADAARAQARVPTPAAPGQVAAPIILAEPEVDTVAEATRMAKEAGDLDGLRAAMAAYPHCDLQKGARNLVFADGDPAARVMIIGEAPGRDEDTQGRPFVGRAGQLLDKMLAAIDMGRANAAAPVYITNILPWRPPQNRDPSPDEMAMMMPFVQRHVELVSPDVLVLMGNFACQGVLHRKGILRMRGQWTEGLGKPVLPMLHPAYLLRNPVMKREAWADLLSLRAWLRDNP